MLAKDVYSEVRVNITGLDTGEKKVGELSANVYAICPKTGDSKFTCSMSVLELAGLLAYLNQYEMIKDTSKNLSGIFVQVDSKDEELITLLRTSEHKQIVPALKAIVKEKLSSDDLNTILGRKDALVTFGEMLASNPPHSEPEWQIFFESNDWILGYGLRYCYLSILQRECRVSGTDLDGKNAVISDFLMSDARFTKIVELKRPDTPLFKAKKNRSESWCLSDDLTNAVSQILSQKAQWEIESRGDCYASNGNKITEKTHDVECVLVIGSGQQFSGDTKDSAIKASTLELYRRNMRNIEILLYDELFERAKFIVDGNNKPFHAMAETSTLDPTF